MNVKQFGWGVVARYIIAVLLICICILVFLDTKLFDEMTRKVAEEIFLALATALVIIIIVDIPSRGELRQEIASEINKNLQSLTQVTAEIRQHALDIERNAYKTAFAGRVPRDFLDVIQHRTFKEPFLREILRANWHFDILDNEKVIAQVDSTSVIRNVTDTAQPYTPIFYFDQRQGDPKVRKVTVNNIEQDLAKHQLKSASPEKPDLILQLPTVSVQPNGTVEVLSDFQFNRSYEDWESWTTLYPCRSMTLRVYYPDAQQCKVEYFKIDELGNLPLKRRDYETYIDIDIQDKILPDQGLIFAWRFVAAK